MTVAAETKDKAQAERRQWMALLARAEETELDEIVERLGGLPEYRMLRSPEIGLTMLRGRTGGSGAAFNLGEATVTRCSVTLEGGSVGHAYLLGRAPRRARQAAILDALFLSRGDTAPTPTELLAPIIARLAAAENDRAEKTAATKVDFFTLVRGENG